MSDEKDMLRVLGDGHVRLVEAMGNDLSIVRSARVSYNAEWRAGEDESKDEKLIRYLYNNRHTTPFESVVFTFEVKAPIFVFRQWHRHRTWSYNEISARYTELPEDFYVPKARLIGVQDTRNKQARTITEDYGKAYEIDLDKEYWEYLHGMGINRVHIHPMKQPHEDLIRYSEFKIVSFDHPLRPNAIMISVADDDNKSVDISDWLPMIDESRKEAKDHHTTISYYRTMARSSFTAYRKLLEEGWPRELARSILPVSTYSRMFATVDLHNLFHFLRLRLDAHAQYEIRCYAYAMFLLMQKVVPVASSAFLESMKFDVGGLDVR